MSFLTAEKLNQASILVAEHDLDPELIKSNLFEMEWPPKSGKIASFPEVGKAKWMGLAEAREMILPSQLPLIDRLAAMVNAG